MHLILLREIKIKTKIILFYKIYFRVKRYLMYNSSFYYFIYFIIDIHTKSYKIKMVFFKN